MRIPTDKQIRALHEKHAPTGAVFDRVYSHCEIVCRIAEGLLARGAPGLADLDADLVRAGGLLHDIGVYRLFDTTGRLTRTPYIRHGVLGHELLAEEGLPPELCRFCSCHTGMGLTRDDIRRRRLPIPPGDYVAESGEERLVMYADKFHSKSEPPAFVTAGAYTTAVRRFGEHKVAIFESLRERFGDPDLAPFAEEYGHAVM
ncbi:MAG TPA: HD domain-containing protein [Streptosporangiaceae bacterium]|nr:HD domain-containing protein [Streptosporangiaceae bacterium]